MQLSLCASRNKLSWVEPWSRCVSVYQFLRQAHRLYVTIHCPLFQLVWIKGRYRSHLAYLAAVYLRNRHPGPDRSVHYRLPGAYSHTSNSSSPTIPARTARLTANIHDLVSPSARLNQATFVLLCSVRPYRYSGRGTTGWSLSQQQNHPTSTATRFRSSNRTEAASPDNGQIRSKLVRRRNSLAHIRLLLLPTSSLVGPPDYRARLLGCLANHSLHGFPLKHPQLHSHRVVTFNTALHCP